MRLATLLAASLLIFPSVCIAQSPPKFDVQRIADGVYAVLRTDPPGLMFEANSGFVVSDDGVIVIDGGSNPASAAEVLAAVRRVTEKPVRYVINTHWHGDHVAGNQVYADAFPGVELVAHASSREDMATEGEAARRQFAEGAPQAAASIRALVDAGKGMDGQPLTAEERASHESTIALAEHALAQAPGVRPVLPTLTLEDRLTLSRGGRTIDVRWLGRAHTRGDVVVHLPREGILFTGDLVSWPVPLVGTTSFPLDYGAALDKLVGLGAATFVPGHGPVLRDDSYPRLMARLLASIKEQTEAAVARGETLEQARRSVDLSEFRRAIAGDSKVRNLLFTQYVAGPAVARAYEHASAKR